MMLGGGIDDGREARGDLPGAAAARHARPDLGVRGGVLAGARRCTVGLLGVLLPLAAMERFVRIAMVSASVFAGLALLESALWVWEKVASEPLPEFVAADGAARARPAAGDPDQDRPHAERSGHAAVLAKA